MPRCDALQGQTGRPRPRKLRDLAAELVGMHIQGNEHSSAEDAVAALRIYRALRTEWERWVVHKRTKNREGMRRALQAAQALVQALTAKSVGGAAAAVVATATSSGSGTAAAVAVAAKASGVQVLTAGLTRKQAVAATTFASRARSLQTSLSEYSA